MRALTLKLNNARQRGTSSPDKSRKSRVVTLAMKVLVVTAATSLVLAGDFMISYDTPCTVRRICMHIADFWARHMGFSGE